MSSRRCSPPASVDKETKVERCTPLFIACQAATEVVAALIAANADLQRSEPCGAPLIAASNFGHVEVVKRLLAANVTDVQDADGNTGLLSRASRATISSRSCSLLTVWR